MPSQGSVKIQTTLKVLEKASETQSIYVQHNKKQHGERDDIHAQKGTVAVVRGVGQVKGGIERADKVPAVRVKEKNTNIFNGSAEPGKGVRKRSPVTAGSAEKTESANAKANKTGPSH